MTSLTWTGTVQNVISATAKRCLGTDDESLLDVTTVTNWVKNQHKLEKIVGLGTMSPPTNMVQNPKPQPEKTEVLWLKIIFFVYVHLASFYSIYLFLLAPSVRTVIYYFILLFMATHGTAVGAHRLWAHRTFKAKLPLRILLAVEQTLTFQLGIYDWVRDHRLHHKHSDTEFDPHNSTKGFCWSHMGWLFFRKPPHVLKKGRELDLSDLLADPVVVFQRRYYWYVAPFIAFVIPAAIPWHFWGVPFWDAFHMFGASRFCVGLHATCLVNSAAHMWGNKPYDKNISPVENIVVSFFSSGEGFHNYHHAFPWDYKAAELGSYYGNLNTAFIDLMAKLGLAYDLKYASREMIARRAKRTGDGSWKDVNVWGWGDKDMDKDDVKMTEITSQLSQNAN